MALYKAPDRSEIISSRIAGLNIDPVNLFCRENGVVVILHPSFYGMAVSPNNARFKVSAAEPFVSFFGVCVGKRKGINVMTVCL